MFWLTGAMLATAKSYFEKGVDPDLRDSLKEARPVKTRQSPGGVGSPARIRPSVAHRGNSMLQSLQTGSPVGEPNYD